MNASRAGRIGLGCVALGLLVVGAATGCDAIIGIEDLSAAPTNNGVNCQLPSDCPGTGNACLVRSCVDGKCQVSEVPDGPSGAQTPGDCQTVSCSAGQPSSMPDPADTAEDGNPCTVDACIDGMPGATNAMSGTDCQQDNNQPGVCDGSGSCVECVSNAQCTAPATCNNKNRCVAPHCTNMIKDVNETDVNCGGPDCDPCANGKDCEQGSDCVSLVCGDNQKCSAPACDDSVLNGAETDKDCGGPDCNPCALTKTCLVNDDCESVFCKCMQQDCACAPPMCDDGVMNGTEIDIDCGPDCDHTCADGGQCLDDVWCKSSVCGNGNVCSAPSCSDGVLNGLEVMVDCGGPDCDPCM